MNEQRTRMKIAIDGKVYLLDTGVRKSLTQIPWESRKKVIAILEAMKQAEHVETAKPPAKTTVEPKETVNQPSTMVKPAIDPNTDKVNPVDANSKDPDAIMQQLLMQQPPSHNIPDKMTAIKWIAIFFALIISLAILI